MDILYKLVNITLLWYGYPEMLCSSIHSDDIYGPSSMNVFPKSEHLFTVSRTPCLTYHRDCIRNFDLRTTPKVFRESFLGSMAGLHGMIQNKLNFYSPQRTLSKKNLENNVFRRLQGKNFRSGSSSVFTSPNHEWERREPMYYWPFTHEYPRHYSDTFYVHFIEVFGSVVFDLQGRLLYYLGCDLGAFIKRNFF